MQRNERYNPKRRLASNPDLAALEELAKYVQYGGNPEHKKNPGDFRLTPPSGPRAGKSLCDAAGIFTRNEALEYLRQAFTHGLVSERRNGKWPQNVWCIMKNGIALEAQLENPDVGSYHGYPMPESDPFIDTVRSRWKEVLR